MEDCPTNCRQQNETVWITAEQFTEVLDATDPDKKVEALDKIFNKNLDRICPTKAIKTSTLDKPWMTDQLKRLARAKKREYHKNGKSNKYRPR